MDPQQNKLSFEELLELPAVIFNDGIEQSYGKALRDVGFTTIKQNKWVHDLGTGIRKIVIIRHMKGASAPMWGYSLDYVPHFCSSQRNIYWHRTNKSALVDVFPLYFDFHQYSMPRFSSDQKHIQRLQSFTPHMIQHMNDFYNLGNETQNLVDILKRCENVVSNGLGFWNYCQLPLAYAFTLNKNGNNTEAYKLLEDYLNHYPNIDPKAKIKLIARFDNVQTI